MSNKPTKNDPVIKNKDLAARYWNLQEDSSEILQNLRRNNVKNNNEFLKSLLYKHALFRLKKEGNITLLGIHALICKIKELYIHQPFMEKYVHFKFYF